MATKVYVYRGVPGAGKSTLIAKRHKAEDTLVFSADKYFIDQNGTYNYLAADAGKAHRWCMRSFIGSVLDIANWSLDRPPADLVVDNTNTRISELAPYVGVAQAYDLEVEIITILCDYSTAFARNRHGVPLNIVERMDHQLRTADIPHWWKHTLVGPDGEPTTW